MRHSSGSWRDFRLALNLKSSYCLEIICADFLAGINLEVGEENTLFLTFGRAIGVLPVESAED